MPALAISVLVRRSRWPIVDSLTRNARAICCVESPATVLSVSARDPPSERGVTAGEEQSEPVVVVRAVSRRRGRDLLGQRLQRPQLVLLDPTSLEHVECAVA